MGVPVPFEKLTYRNKVTEQSFGSTVVQPLVSYRKSVDGHGVVRRPGWKNFSRRDKANPLPYLKIWETENRSLYSVRIDESGPGGYVYFYDSRGPIDHSLFPADAVIPGVASEARYKALNKLFTELKGEGANLANMLGERKQVVNSIVNVLNTIVYTVRDLKRGNLSSAIRRMGGDPLTARKLKKVDIANQWLSLQYGWKPLLSDVYDLVNGLHKRESTLPKTFRATGYQNEIGKSTSGWTQDWKGVFHGIRGTRAAHKFMIRAYPNLSLAEPAALGFTNPLTVAWEITPWSFVVDWFLPVGSYLEQLTADHGWTFYDGCETSFVKAAEVGDYVVYHAGPESDPAYFISSVVTQQGNTMYVKMERNVLVAFPSPSLPHFKNPFSIGHVENGLALLSQVFSGSKPRR